ncbi:MAG: hypothetical protein O2958_05235 [Gemmatimonadetes bacterium]|nr:hypothetical protein [Gemmatimonadota bacterium]MDA1102826.1 hypothetical protein [Gemmatimonadota bacterium]
MIRWLLFFGLAGGLTAYSFWVYLRVDLPVPAARALAAVRATALVLLLLLLFDVRVPAGGVGGAPTRWVLLDVSLSMAAPGPDGVAAWTGASTRADELRREGWNVVRFGGTTLTAGLEFDALPDALTTRLAPALAAAAEGGAREVRVLSDLRFDDGVAIRAALTALPLDVAFEGFGSAVTNAGIARFEVSDLLQPDRPMTAELEVHGGATGDSLLVEIFEEAESVSRIWVRAPSSGLRSGVDLELPPPSSTGRIRYTARVSLGSDAFESDDASVAYATVGYEEGAVVLVSLAPDWEPRHLLPVLEDVTGLPTVGYLRAGPDRYVRLGRAIDRGAPVDSAAVRRAAVDATIFVVHGLGADSDEWVSALVARPGRRLLLPIDPAGAATAGIEVAPPRSGEWYASPDIPTSPIAGALSGVPLQGLPPLTAVMTMDQDAGAATLHLQLRGAGAPENGFRLVDRSTGRMAVSLASGFWRWAMRDAGREPYRRIWSGVVGWILSDQEILASEPRPTRWVVDRGAPVDWSLPSDGAPARIVVRSGEDVVVDTVIGGVGSASTGTLPPGAYSYSVLDIAQDTLAAGRFDVATATTEMLPASMLPDLVGAGSARGRAGDGAGRPLRTFPWPFILVIVLLCGEWIVRRRSGLR